MSKMTFLPLVGEYVVLVTSIFVAGSSFVPASVNGPLAGQHPVRCGSESEATDASSSGGNPTDQIYLPATLPSGASLQSQGQRPDESSGSGRIEGYRSSSTPMVSTRSSAEQASTHTGNIIARTTDSSSSSSSSISRKTAKESLSQIMRVPVHGAPVQPQWRSVHCT